MSLCKAFFYYFNRTHFPYECELHKKLQTKLKREIKIDGHARAHFSRRI
jgi:hypothetical protein